MTREMVFRMRFGPRRRCWPARVGLHDRFTNLHGAHRPLRIGRRSVCQNRGARICAARPPAIASNHIDSCTRCVGPKHFSHSQEVQRHPPPSAVALYLLVGGVDARIAVSSAFLSGPAPLGSDRLPPPSGNRMRAHTPPSLAVSWLTGQGSSVVRHSQRIATCQFA
jgi:hypothetical protein